MHAKILLWQSSSDMSRHPTFTGPRGTSDRVNGGQKLSTCVRKTGPPRDRGPSMESKDLPFFLQSFTWNEIEKHNHLGVCVAKCVSAVGLLYFSFCRKLLVIGCILV